MNNWTVVFIIIGIVLVLSIISGFLLTNKAINIGGKVASDLNVDGTPESIIN